MLDFIVDHKICQSVTKFIAMNNFLCENKNVRSSAPAYVIKENKLFLLCIKKYFNLLRIDFILFFYFVKRKKQFHSVETSSQV